MSEEVKTHFLQPGTKANALARQMREALRGYDDEIKQLHKDLEEVQRRRMGELKGQMGLILTEIEIDDDPMKWAIDARYLDAHGLAFLVSNNPSPFERMFGDVEDDEEDDD